MQHVHLIGICGTGMASLAGLFAESDWKVTGSDTQAYPPMSTMLESLGIPVTLGYSADNLATKPDLVIIGNVCTPDNIEARAAIDGGFNYLSMADAVAEYFCQDNHSIVITGTHGKTTTASLMAWLLDGTDHTPGFLIGGIPNNFTRSFRSAHNSYFVIEGDEYDTAFFDKTPKFLHYPANTLLLGPVEFDHADIYADLDAVMAEFTKLVAQQPKDGLIIADVDNNNTRELLQHARCPVIAYSLENHAESNAQVRITKREAHGTHFHLQYQQRGHDFFVPLVGEHNVRNCAATLLAALAQHIDPAELNSTLGEFSGIKRRQEVRGIVNGVTVIDDFAHHPTAIASTLAALRQQYPQQRFLVAFEPRSNTSGRNIFHEAYLHAFHEAAQVFFAPVHKTDRIPASERLDLEQLSTQLSAQGVASAIYPSTDDILRALCEAHTGDIIIIMSNGDFDNLHTRVLHQLESTA